jgi:hypothetical protein
MMQSVKKKGPDFWHGLGLRPQAGVTTMQPKASSQTKLQSID